MKLLCVLLYHAVVSVGAGTNRLYSEIRCRSVTSSVYIGAGIAQWWKAEEYG
jgi:hypothetical protein